MMIGLLFVMERGWRLVGGVKVSYSACDSLVQKRMWSSNLAAMILTSTMAWLAPLNSVGYIFAICPNLLDNFKQGQNRYHQQFFRQVNYELKSREWVSEE